MKTLQVRLLCSVFRVVLLAHYVDLETKIIDSQSITPNRLFCQQNHPNIVFCKKLPFSAIRRGGILMQILYREGTPELLSRHTLF